MKHASRPISSAVAPVPLLRPLFAGPAPPSTAVPAAAADLFNTLMK